MTRDGSGLVFCDDLQDMSTVHVIHRFEVTVERFLKLSDGSGHLISRERGIEYSQNADLQREIDGVSLDAVEYAIDLLRK